MTGVLLRGTSGGNLVQPLIKIFNLGQVQAIWLSLNKSKDRTVIGSCFNSLFNFFLSS